MGAGRLGRRRGRRRIKVVALAFVAVACGTSTGAASSSARSVPPAAATLRRAAAATAAATGFVAHFPGADVTYQAPDRVEQVEHGEASSASASDHGPGSTTGPSPASITKIFIADRYYESDTAGGHQAPFSASARCPGDTNAGEYLLRILRELASAQTVHIVDGGFGFSIPAGPGVPFPSSWIATVAAGYVTALSPGGGAPPSITITAVNHAPPVTAPAAATPAEQECGTTVSGSGGPGASSAGVGTAVVRP